jgi:hypothetical protein
VLTRSSSYELDVVSGAITPVMTDHGLIEIIDSTRTKVAGGVVYAGTVVHCATHGTSIWMADPKEAESYFGSLAELCALGSYADVQRKAAAIYRAGGVEPIRITPAMAEADVRSSSGSTYRTLLNFENSGGSARIVDWACECPWSKWNYERAPEYKYLEHRKCAHALAFLYMLQAFKQVTDPYLKEGMAQLYCWDPDGHEMVIDGRKIRHLSEEERTHENGASYVVLSDGRDSFTAPAEDWDAVKHLSQYARVQRRALENYPGQRGQKFKVSDEVTVMRSGGPNPSSWTGTVEETTGSGKVTRIQVGDSDLRIDLGPTDAIELNSG